MAIDPGTAEIIGSGIGAAGSLLGGLGDDGAKEAADDQVRFAKKAIRWRVRDAKAAGLHPLYALGASTNAFSPSFIGGQSRTGGAISDAAQHIAQGVKDYGRVGSLTPVDQSVINRNDAAAALDLSRARLVEQDITRRQDFSINTQDEDVAVPRGLTEPFPPKIPIASKLNPAVSAGKRPGLSRHRIGTVPGTDQGVWITTLYSEEGPAEGMEGVGPTAIMIGATSYELGKLSLKGWRMIWDKVGPAARKKLFEYLKKHKIKVPEKTYAPYGGKF